MMGRLLGTTLPLLLVAHLGTLSAALRVDSRNRTSGKTFEKCVRRYADTLDTKVLSGLGHSIRRQSWDFPSTSDRMIAWGTGFGTTATRSLEAALKALGLNVWHWTTDSWVMNIVNVIREEVGESCRAQVREELLAMPKFVQAFIDTPSAELFLTAFKIFPNARFLHTDRNATQWAASRLKGHPNTFPPLQNPCAVTYQCKGHHCSMFPHGQRQRSTDFSEEQLAEMFKAHNALVRCVVPPKRLIDIDLFEASEEKKRHVAQQLTKFLLLPEGRSISQFPIVKSGEDIDILRRFEPVQVETGMPCLVNLTEVCDQAEDPLLKHNVTEQEAHWDRVYDALNNELVKYGCKLHL